MDLKPDQLVDVANAVERQGGCVLDDPCNGQTIHLKKPSASGQMITDSVKTCACYHHSRFGVKYGDGSLVIACAICDNIAMWPRFKGTV